MTPSRLVCLLLGLYLCAPALVAGTGCCQRAVAGFSGGQRTSTTSCRNVASSSDCATSYPAEAYTDGFSCSTTSATVSGSTGVTNLCTVSTTSGGLKSDPILQGFDNSTFEFCGHPGHNYSLVVAPSLTLNMALVPAGNEHIRPQGGEGTFAGSMAVLLPSSTLTLIASVDKKGNMSLSVDGHGVNVEQPHAWGQVTYEPYLPGKGQVVSVTEPPFKFSIVAVKQYVDEESGYNRGHLDLAVETTGPVLSTVSGVLGQTLNAAYNSMDEAEFEIPTLTFARNVQPLVRRSRQLLVPSSLDTYPLHASMS